MADVLRHTALQWGPMFARSTPLHISGSMYRFPPTLSFPPPSFSSFIVCDPLVLPSFTLSCIQVHSWCVVQRFSVAGHLLLYNVRVHTSLSPFDFVRSLAFVSFEVQHIMRRGMADPRCVFPGGSRLVSLPWIRHYNPFPVFMPTFFSLFLACIVIFHTLTYFTGQMAVSSLSFTSSFIFRLYYM